MKARIKQIGAYVWKVMSRNVFLKILSLVFAVMLWSYVVSSNTSITRVKTLTGLTGYVNGQATLEMYKLALLTDPGEALSDITVQLQVPQASYAQAASSNVQVLLDVSSVRTAGTQEVPIRATSSIGRVVDIYPSSVQLTFEALDSRSIPVNVDLSGGDDSYWYSCSRINPQQVTVTGATSLVQSISQASVTADMTGHTSTFTNAHAFSLIDAAGNTISTTMLSLPVSSISVTTEVYPTKLLTVSDAAEDVLIGQVADGYEIEDIVMQPDTVTVAAEKELLDGIDKLVIEPIEIDSPTQSFTKRAAITSLPDFKYISSEQVYVNVQIGEEIAGAWLDEVYLNYIGKQDGLTLSWQKNSVAVHVSGPRSSVELLLKEGLTATVDLTGYGAGSYTVPVIIDKDNYPDIDFEMEAYEVQVTLDEEVSAE